MMTYCRWRALFPASAPQRRQYIWQDLVTDLMVMDSECGVRKRLKISGLPLFFAGWPIREGCAEAPLYWPISLHGFIGGRSRWPCTALPLLFHVNLYPLDVCMPTHFVNNGWESKHHEVGVWLIWPKPKTACATAEYIKEALSFVSVLSSWNYHGDWKMTTC